MFYAYMLFSKKLDVFYKGSTSNVPLRFQQHLLGKAKYTSQTDDWIIVFVRAFDSKTEALKYEKMLKRQKRDYFNWLIKQQFNIVEEFSQT